MSDDRDRLVLVVLHEEELGGASISVLRCVPGLERRGWRFSFWVPRPSSLFERLSGEGREVLGAERPIAYSLAAARLEPGLIRRALQAPGYVRAFGRALAGLHPRLVHANSHTTLVEAWLAHRRGIATVFHVHEMFGSGPKWALGRRVARRVGDQLVAVSGASADALGAGVPPVRVVPNGVTVPDRPVETRAGPDLTVGTVGVVSRRKGSDVFVEAARLASERRPALRFELVGSSTAEPLDAEWARTVLTRAKEVGVEHLERTDVAMRMGGWDLFVLPSRRDPFPLSMLEAMAAGLPVIGAAVDGIREQVTSQTGVLFELDDPAALADTIVELADSPERRATLGAAARERVGSAFSLERQADGLDAAYEAAIADPRR